MHRVVGKRALTLAWHNFSWATHEQLGGRVHSKPTLNLKGVVYRLLSSSKGSFSVSKGGVYGAVIPTFTKFVRVSSVECPRLNSAVCT